MFLSIQSTLPSRAPIAPASALSLILSANVSFVPLRSSPAVLSSINPTLPSSTPIASGSVLAIIFSAYVSLVSLRSPLAFSLFITLTALSSIPVAFESMLSFIFFAICISFSSFSNRHVNRLSYPKALITQIKKLQELKLLFQSI